MQRVDLQILAFAFLAGCSLLHHDNKPKARESVPRTKAIEESVAVFKRALMGVEENYFDDTDPRFLTMWAIRGMIEKLNSHGELEWQKDTVQCEEGHDLEGFGIGIRFSRIRGITYITQVAPMSNAFAAGVMSGDIIFEIDGEPTHLLSIIEVARRLRCRTNEVTLTIIRGKRLVEKRLTKGPVKYRESFSVPLSQNIGYLYLPHLADDETALESFGNYIDLVAHRSNKLILDLRSMKGGMLTSTRLFLSMFLPPNALIVTPISVREVEEAWRVPEWAKPTRMRIVVLLNLFTGSAGEIIALALQSHGRAVLIGERTLGYGTIRRPLPLSDDAQLFLPVALYYGPHGEMIERMGVWPDISVINTNPIAHYYPGVRDDILDAAIRYLRNAH